MEKEHDIHKNLMGTNYQVPTPDDQKTLYDRLGNQDPKIREMAYITLSTLYLGKDQALNNEVFSEYMTKRIIKALSDPIRKNALCVFGIINNILTAADLMNKPEVLAEYVKQGLFDTICENVKTCVEEVDKMGDDMTNSDLERTIFYIEEAFKLLQAIVSCASI